MAGIIRQESYFNLCREGNEHLVIERIKRLTERNKVMTPQEELFANFFRAEKILVKDMNVLQLRAHREELAAIAFEARARLTAVDSEEKERKPSSGVTGFQRSVNTDDTTSDAINAIENRNKRLNKKEKLRKSLEAMGVETADIDKIMSARNIRDVVESDRPISQSKQSTEQKRANSAIGGSIDWDKITAEALANNAAKAANQVVNPFASSPSSNGNADSPHVIESTEQIDEPKEVKPIFNPFAK